MRGLIVACFALLLAVDPQPKKPKKGFKKFLNCVKRDKKKDTRPIVVSSPPLVPPVMAVPTQDLGDVSSPSISSSAYHTALSDAEQNRVFSQNAIENLVQTSAIEFDRQSLSQRQQRSPNGSLRRPSRDRSPSPRRKSKESLNGERRSSNGSQNGSPKLPRRPSTTRFEIFEPQPKLTRPPTPPLPPVDVLPIPAITPHNQYPALVPPEGPPPEPEQSSSAENISLFGKVKKFAQNLDPRKWFPDQKEVELVRLPPEAEKDAGFFTRSWYWLKNMFRNIPVGLVGTVQYFIDYFRGRTIRNVQAKVVAKVLEDPETIAQAQRNYIKSATKQNNIVANYRYNTNERLRVFEANH